MAIHDESARNSTPSSRIGGTKAEQVVRSPRVPEPEPVRDSKGQLPLMGGADEKTNPKA